MTVVVITPPEPIVTFEEAKQHVRIDDDGEKVYVESLISAATAWIDGPAGWLGRAIGPQLLEWRLSNWPCGNWRWPIVPFIEIDTVIYVDRDGVEQEWPVPIPLAFDGMPVVRGEDGDVRIRYWAGYGKRDATTPANWISAAPPPVKVAILMLVAQWYYVRENVITGTITSEMPFAVDALLQPYRVYR